MLSEGKKRPGISDFVLEKRHKGVKKIGGSRPDFEKCLPNACFFVVFYISSFCANLSSAINVSPELDRSAAIGTSSVAFGAGLHLDQRTANAMDRNCQQSVLVQTRLHRAYAIFV